MLALTLTKLSSTYRLHVSTTAGVIATALELMILMLQRRLFVNRNVVKITPLQTLKQKYQKTLECFQFFCKF